MSVVVSSRRRSGGDNTARATIVNPQQRLVMGGYVFADAKDRQSETLRWATRTGRPAGDLSFIESLEKMTDHTLKQGKSKLENLLCPPNNPKRRVIYPKRANYSGKCPYFIKSDVLLSACPRWHVGTWRALPEFLAFQF